MTSREAFTALETVNECYKATREGRPDDTAKVIITALGVDTAAAVMAVMIREAAWDGRISREAKTWAAGVNIPDEIASRTEYFHSDIIHKAHLSQIAEAMPAALEAAREEAAREEAAAAVCVFCGCPIEDPDDVCKDYDGDPCCHACFADRCAVCDRCGEVIDKDFAARVGKGGSFVCKKCEKAAYPFRRLKKALEKQNREYLKNLAVYINRGYWPTWADKTAGDGGLQRYSTAGNWDKYKAGTLDRKTAVEKALRRAQKQQEKQHAKRLERLQAVANAPDLYAVELSIIWHRSSTWGHNPKCEARIRTADGWEYYTGTASGCGYDKESASAATALNLSLSVLKALYTRKEKARGRISTELNDPNGKYVAYGAGYGVLPYFEGGVGMDSFRQVFEACGYKLTHDEHGKDRDYYVFERKGV